MNYKSIMNKGSQILDKLKTEWTDLKKKKVQYVWKEQNINIWIASLEVDTKCQYETISHQNMLRCLVNEW